MKFTSKNLRCRRKRKNNNNLIAWHNRKKNGIAVQDLTTATIQSPVEVDNNTPSSSSVSKAFKELDNRSESKISANNVLSDHLRTRHRKKDAL